MIDTITMADGGEPMYIQYFAVTDQFFVGDRANGRVVAFDPDTFEIEGFVESGDGVFHMSGNEELGQLWVTNDVELSISVIDVVAMQRLATIPAPADLVALGGVPHDIRVGPDGLFVYVSFVNITGYKDFVVQYDTSTLQEVGRAAVGDAPHLSIADGTHLFAPSQGANAVWVIDRVSMDVIKIIPVPGAHGEDIRNQGDYLYITNLPSEGEDALWTIDTQTLEVVGEPTDAPFTVPHNIETTADGRKLYVTHSGATANQVSIYKLSNTTGRPGLIRTVTVGANPFGIGFVP